MTTRKPLTAQKRRLLHTIQALDAGASVASLYQSIRLFSSDLSDWRGMAWVGGFGVFVAAFWVLRSLLRVTLIQRGRENVATSAKSHRVYYPVPYRTPPNLRISRLRHVRAVVNGERVIYSSRSSETPPELEFIEQTVLGFVVQGPFEAFSWRAHGVPDDQPISPIKPE